jgi:Holliday junction resolvase RusA-like endonuclease
MEINIKLNSPPFSINKSHYRNGNRTVENRAWGEKILEQLYKHKNEFEEFNKYVNKFINDIELQVSLIYYMPREKLYTKKGKVNGNSMDLSNIEKGLLDLIFDKRFNKRGWVNLNLDDALITRLVSEKIPSLTGKYHIQVKIKTVLSKK